MLDNWVLIYNALLRENSCYARMQIDGRPASSGTAILLGTKYIDGIYAVAPTIARRHTRRANVIDQLHKAIAKMI